MSKKHRRKGARQSAQQPAPAPEQAAAKEESFEGVSVSGEAQSGVLHTLTVTLSAERVRAALEDAYRHVRVRGFRQGRAPKNLVAKMYGETLRENVKLALVQSTLPHALQESGLTPVTQPRLKAEPPAENAGKEGYSYQAEVEVYPEISLPELKGLPAQRPKVEVREDEIDAELQALRERRAPWPEAPAAAAAAREGDRVTFDYQGEINGESFEGGSAENAVMLLGAGHFLPGFEEGVQGKSKGDQAQIQSAFPDDYSDEKLAGKKADFALKIKRVERRELPRLDDAFAQSLGDPDINTLQSLRLQLRHGMLQQRTRLADQQTRRSLLQALLARCNFDAPPGMVRQQLDAKLRRANQQLAQYFPEKNREQQMQKWEEEWRDTAELEVREMLALNAVADAQQLRVEPEEVDEQLAAEAAEQGLDSARLKRMYKEQGMLENLKAQMREDKAFAFLLSGATISETPAAAAAENETAAGESETAAAPATESPQPPE